MRHFAALFFSSLKNMIRAEKNSFLLEIFQKSSFVEGLKKRMEWISGYFLRVTSKSNLQ